MRNLFLITLAVALCGFAFYNRKNIDLFFTKPTCNQFNLKIDKEYVIKRVNIIDSNSLGVFCPPNGLYYVKLDLHVVEDAKKDIIELFNQADRLGLIVKRVVTERHIGGRTDVYAEIIVYHGSSRFTLSNWLREKGKVFSN